MNEAKERWADLINPVMFWVLSGFGVAAVISVILPALMVSGKGGRRNADVQNIRQLGIALMAAASASDDQTYPVTSDGTHIAVTATEAFDYLLRQKEIPVADLFFSRGRDKIKYAGSGKITAQNVGYNYIKANENGKDRGVSLNADDYLPLLWSAGNAPLIVTPGGALTLLDTGIYGKSSCVVYYKGNSARLIRANGSGKIDKFVSDTFKASSVRYSELAP